MFLLNVGISFTFSKMFLLNVGLGHCHLFLNVNFSLTVYSHFTSPPNPTGWELYLLFLPLQFTLLRLLSSHESCVTLLDDVWIAVGAWVPVSQLAEQEVTAYRQLEEDKISKVLDDLLDICKSQKVEISSFSGSFFFIMIIILYFDTPSCQYHQY